METERVRYDQEADILYMWSIEPETVEDIITEETGNEILVKRNANNGELVGITVLNFSSRQDSINGIDIEQALQYV